MKKELETIPVWDSYKEDCECPLCLLKIKCEENYIRFYLGSSVMNPETRVRVNDNGFCEDHFSKLLKEKKAHAIGLMSHTHLQKTISKLEPLLDQAIKESDSSTQKKIALKHNPKLVSNIDKLIKSLNENSNSCLICNDIERSMLRYKKTILWLWKEDPEFRDANKNSKGFCNGHLADILELAKDNLKPTQLPEFTYETLNCCKNRLLKLEKDIEWFTLKFDAQNSAKPWGDSKNAHKRTIQKLSGVGFPTEELE